MNTIPITYIPYRKPQEQRYTGIVSIGQPKHHYYHAERLQTGVWAQASDLEQMQLNHIQLVRLAAIQDALGAKVSKSWWRADGHDHPRALQVGRGTLFMLDAPYHAKPLGDGWESIWLDRDKDFYYPDATYPRISKPAGSTADIVAMAKVINAMTMPDATLTPIAPKA
jgi:hypothetical protein